jgi:hypothetical protein
MNDLKAMEQRISACKTNQEREDHPDAPWLLAAAIWISRRRAGETVNFGDAIDFPMDELTFEMTPEEQAAAEKAASEPDPTQRRASGPAGVRPADRKVKAAKASRTRSSAA